MSPLGQYFYLAAPSFDRCPVCEEAAGQDVIRCTKCCLVSYCSFEHQLAHQPRHLVICEFTERIFVKDFDIVKERIFLPISFREAPSLDDDKCWHFIERTGLSQSYYKRLAPSQKRLQEAYCYEKEIRMLNKGDDESTESTVPLLMLRLDLDRGVYNFYKLKTAAPFRRPREPSEPKLRPLHHWHKDHVYEDVTSLLKERHRPDHLIILIALKLKLLVDIRNLKISRKLLGQARFPAEIIYMFENLLVKSPLSLSLLKLSYADLVKSELRLLSDAQLLGAAVKYFMHSLLLPKEDPIPYTHPIDKWIKWDQILNSTYTAF